MERVRERNTIERRLCETAKEVFAESVRESERRGCSERQKEKLREIKHI